MVSLPLLLFPFFLMLGFWNKFGISRDDLLPYFFFIFKQFRPLTFLRCTLKGFYIILFFVPSFKLPRKYRPATMVREVQKSDLSVASTCGEHRLSLGTRAGAIAPPRSAHAVPHSRLALASSSLIGTL